MRPKYYVGVDGGGTKCRVRLTNHSNEVLAECEGGSANVYSNFDNTINEVNKLIEQVFIQAKLPLSSIQYASVVFGLAGANVLSYRKRAQQSLGNFAYHLVVSDAEIACIGGHLGKPGSVLTVGTGSQGARWDGKTFSLVGGWGMTLSDQGSGANLGYRAIRTALQAHEGLIAHSDLTRQLMQFFQHSAENLLDWSVQATPADWGQFSPAIFDYAAQKDSVALQLIQNTAKEIDQLLDYLTFNGENKATLMGGMASPIIPWLSRLSRSSLMTPQGDALDGALLLSRELKIESSVTGSTNINILS